MKEEKKLNRDLLNKALVFSIILLLNGIAVPSAISVGNESTMSNNECIKVSDSTDEFSETSIIRYCFIFGEIEGGINDYYRYFGDNFNFVLYGPFKVYQIFPFKTYIFDGRVDGSIKGYHGSLSYGDTGEGIVVRFFGFMRYFEGTQT